MRFVFRLFFLPFLCCFFCGITNGSARADVLAGAPRPLGSDGAFIEGTHAHFDDGELNFVRVTAQAQGARPELWRALPIHSEAKNPAWTIQAHREQSSYLLDVLASQRALSPDGKIVAFVSQRGGQSSIYIVPASDFGRQERARRIATEAQSPTWQDENTLLFESTNLQRGGLFRIAIQGSAKTRSAPQLLFSRGGESTVSPDGQTICVAAKNEDGNGKISDENATQLYLLATDGSGARAIPQTEGARRPCFAPDGTAIFYDAPAPGAQGRSTPRVLWTVPLNAALPTAQLFFVRENQVGDAEIIGTVFSGDVGNLESQIEFWPGEETEFATRPQFSLPVKNTPIHNAALVTWPLPRNAAPQEWTLRLRATDADGQKAQSTLTFLWPPSQTMQPIPAAPISQTTAAQNADAQSRTAQTPVMPTPLIATIEAPVKPSPTAAASVFPTPAISPERGETIKTPSNFPTILADLPAPALPVAPGAATEKLSSVPVPIKAAARAGSNPVTRLAETPVRRGLPEAQTQPAQTQPARKAPPKKVEQKSAPQKAPAPKPQPKPTPQKTGGIPSQMKAGSSTSVEVTLRNTGTRSWSSTGDSPVRLLVRWVRADSKTRYRWAIKWLRSTVTPGQSTTAKIDLDAPSAPGRYILTYSLVRLSPEIYDGKSYKPPPATAADTHWPGEFGAVSFEINVVS